MKTRRPDCFSWQITRQPPDLAGSSRVRALHGHRHPEGGLISRLGQIGHRLYVCDISYDFVGHRTRLVEWADNKTEDELVEYRVAKNSVSIDGLPALSCAAAS